MKVNLRSFCLWSGFFSDITTVYSLTRICRTCSTTSYTLPPCPMLC
jgi:hypothetical protein